MEQRRTKRFALQLPVAITRNGVERVSQTGWTKNISSGGVLFSAGSETDIGGSIEYVIKLGPLERDVSLRCIGKVVRCEKPTDADEAFDVAATLERYEFLRAEPEA